MTFVTLYLVLDYCRASCMTICLWYVCCCCMKVVTAQIYGITEQLQCLGVRSLELDLHYSESCDICGVVWCRVVERSFMSCIASCLLLFNLILFCFDLSCLVLYCIVLSCLALARLDTACLDMPSTYLVVYLSNVGLTSPCHVLSVLLHFDTSCLVLPCFASPHLASLRTCLKNMLFSPSCYLDLAIAPVGDLVEEGDKDSAIRLCHTSTDPAMQLVAICEELGWEFCEEAGVQNFGNDTGCRAEAPTFREGLEVRGRNRA